MYIVQRRATMLRMTAPEFGREDSVRPHGEEAGRCPLQ